MQQVYLSPTRSTHSSGKRVQICSGFSLCLPALGSRSRLTRLTSSKAYRVPSGSVPALPKAAAVLRPTLFPSCGTRIPTGSLIALTQGYQATLRGRYSWPVTRRRQNGFHLCADACLLITGLSHDTWPGECEKNDHSPEIELESQVASYLPSLFLNCVSPTIRARHALSSSPKVLVAF